jgi:hypothetical protein
MVPSFPAIACLADRTAHTDYSAEWPVPLETDKRDSHAGLSILCIMRVRELLQEFIREDDVDDGGIW